MADAEFEKLVFKRLDEHGESIHKIRGEVELINYRVDKVEEAQISSCKIMTETRQEVVTLINALQTSIQQINLSLATDNGKKEQNRWLISFLISMVAIAPSLAVILYSLSGK